MEQATTRLLKAAIRAEQVFYAAPPATVVRSFGLDAGTALAPKFGPDIESYIMYGGYNIYNLSYEAEVADFDHKGFKDDVHRQLAKAGVLFHGDRKPVAVEGIVLETRLAPADPSAICAAYLKARTIMMQTAHNHGGQAFFGTGHWHTSLSHGTHGNLFHNGGNELSAIGQHASAGLLAWQKMFPAFFVKPHIADKENTNMYAGPLRFHREEASCNASIAENTLYGTIENRTALHAPYQPVYLTLAGMRYGLENPDLALARSDYRLAPKTVLGCAGYLAHLRTTLDNMRDTNLIPAALGYALLSESVRSYHHYLSGPAAAMNYRDNELTAAIRARLEQFADRIGGLSPVEKGHSVKPPAPLFA